MHHSPAPAFSSFRARRAAGVSLTLLTLATAPVSVGPADAATRRTLPGRQRTTTAAATPTVAVSAPSTPSTPSRPNVPARRQRTTTVGAARATVAPTPIPVAVTPATGRSGQVTVPSGSASPTTPAATGTFDGMRIADAVQRITAGRATASGSVADSRGIVQPGELWFIERGASGADHYVHLSQTKAIVGSSAQYGGYRMLDDATVENRYYSYGHGQSAPLVGNTREAFLSVRTTARINTALTAPGSTAGTQTGAKAKRAAGKQAPLATLPPPAAAESLVPFYSLQETIKYMTTPNSPAVLTAQLYGNTGQAVGKRVQQTLAAAGSRVPQGGAPAPAPSSGTESCAASAKNAADAVSYLITRGGAVGVVGATGVGVLGSLAALVVGGPEFFGVAVGLSGIEVAFIGAVVAAGAAIVPDVVELTAKASCLQLAKLAADPGATPVPGTSATSPTNGAPMPKCDEWENRAAGAGGSPGQGGNVRAGRAATQSGGDVAVDTGVLDVDVIATDRVCVSWHYEDV